MGSSLIPQHTASVRNCNSRGRPWNSSVMRLPHGWERCIGTAQVQRLSVLGSWGPARAAWCSLLSREPYLVSDVSYQVSLPPKWPQVGYRRLDGRSTAPSYLWLPPKGVSLLIALALQERQNPTFILELLRRAPAREVAPTPPSKAALVDRYIPPAQPFPANRRQRAEISVERCVLW